MFKINYIKYILLLVPLTVVAGQLVFCWWNIFTSDYTPVTKHYLGIIFSIILLIFCLQGFPKALLATGIFLLLGMTNLFSLTPLIISSQFRIGPIKLPPFQPFSTGVFFLYIVLNIVSLMILNEDYRQRQRQANKR
mgnify:CR=1 FL=1